MPSKQLGVHSIPRILPTLELLPTVLTLNVKVAGSVIRDNIRKHTPKRTWFMYGRCKIISLHMTKFTGRVRVGWQKRDFPRGKFYAVWVGEGTGIWGEGHKQITGKKSTTGRTPVLRYQYSGGWSTKKSIKGIQPRKMLEKGYQSSIGEVMFLMSRTTFNFFKVSKRA